MTLLRNQILRRLRTDPGVDPQTLSRELHTTAKYVSKVARFAGLPKFKTGPKRRAHRPLP